MYDTHCHLNDNILHKNIEDVVQSSLKLGVNKIVVPAWDYNSSILGVKIKHEFPANVINGAGIHPFSSENADKDFSWLEDLAKSKHIMAIGETGIDSHYDIEIKSQRKVFEAQLDIAERYGLPVLFHANRGYNTFFETVKNFSGVKGVMHGFSASLEVMAKGLELGFYISFNGLITREKTKRAKEAAKNVPLERLLIETDAPYIAVEGISPACVCPWHVINVAKSVAVLKEIDFALIKEITSLNAEKLFGIF